LNQVRRLPELLVPALLILATAWLGLEVSTYLQAYFLDTLVKVAIVVALYVFIGNSVVTDNLRYGLNATTTGTLWTMKNNLIVNNASATKVDSTVTVTCRRDCRPRIRMGFSSVVDRSLHFRYRMPL